MIKVRYFIPEILIVTSMVACTLQAPIRETALVPTASSPAQQTAINSETNQTLPVSVTPTPARSTTVSASAVSAGLTTTPPQISTQPTKPNATSTPSVPCNLAASGNPIDITIPDDTVIQPGENFTKTWRLKNVGSCTWTQEYYLVWFSGESFGASHQQSISASVAPGETINISVDMTSPENAGTYQSNWKLSSGDDELFGIGPSGDSPFWVRIIVAAPAPTITVSAPVPTPTPVVYLSGVVNLNPGQGLDLDTNQITAVEGADLAYQVEGSGSHTLTPANGAAIGDSNQNEPTIEQCQSDTLGNGPISLDTANTGSYFCFKTSQGLPGWARLVLISPTDDLLALEVLVWSIP